MSTGFGINHIGRAIVIVENVLFKFFGRPVEHISVIPIKFGVVGIVERKIFGLHIVDHPRGLFYFFAARQILIDEIQINHLGEIFIIDALPARRSLVIARAVIGAEISHQVVGVVIAKQIFFDVGDGIALRISHIVSHCEQIQPAFCGAARAEFARRQIVRQF